MRTHSGFTLVELLTVIVILGIAAACVVPQIGTRDDLDAAAAARTLMADLLYAQNRAISTQKAHFVQFATTGYTIFSQDSSTSPLYTINNPTTQTNYVVTLGSASCTFPNINIATANFDGSPSMMLQFDTVGAPWVYNPASGTATPLVGTGTITLSTTPPGLSANVLIDPATGDASAQ